MLRWNRARVNFPITNSDLDAGLLKDAHSCFIHNDPRIVVHPSEFAAPTHPEIGAKFWTEFLEVAIRVDLARKRTRLNSMPASIKSELLPELFEDEKEFLPEMLTHSYRVGTAHELAMLVRADWPTDIMNKMAEWLLSKGYKQRDLFDRKYTRFTDGVVLLASLIGQTIHEISPTAFALKWYHGRARPEMVAGAWARGELDCPKGIDVALSRLINKKQVAEDETTFGIYKAPPHPSYCAMHSAVAAMQVVFPVWFELDEYGVNECRKLAYCVAFGRDFGGVHYRSDDLVGLELGERCIEKILPSMLVQYGADKERVESLIQKYRLPWTKELS